MTVTKPSSGSRLGAIRCVCSSARSASDSLDGLLQRLPQSLGGHLGGKRGTGAVTAAGLVEHRRDHRRQLGRFQPRPRAGAQAFGDQQVALAVDPGQQPAVVGDLRIGGRTLDEAALGEQPDDPVERAGQRIGGGGDLLLAAARCRVRCAGSARPARIWASRSGLLCAGCRRNSARNDASSGSWNAPSRRPITAAATAARTEPPARRRPTAAPRPDRGGPAAGGVRPAWATTSNRPAPTRPNSPPTKSGPPNGVR